MIFILLDFQTIHALEPTPEMELALRGTTTLALIKHSDKLIIPYALYACLYQFQYLIKYYCQCFYLSRIVPSAQPSPELLPELVLKDLEFAACVSNLSFDRSFFAFRIVQVGPISTAYLVS